MIARAMTSRKSSELRYCELAQSRAHIERVLVASQLPRLLDICAGDNARAAPDLAVPVELDFAIDEHGNTTVSGNARCTAPLECHLCAEAVLCTYQAELDAVLVENDAAAGEFDRAGFGIEKTVVVVGDTLDVAALVEDELLLQMPREVCTDLQCPRRPDMCYGDAATDTDLAVVTERPNPFRVLSTLKEQPPD